MPPTYLSFIYLVLDTLLYAVLAWFLDAVIPGQFIGIIESDQPFCWSSPALLLIHVLYTQQS